MENWVDMILKFPIKNAFMMVEMMMQYHIFEQDDGNEYVTINSMANALVVCCVVFRCISLRIDH
jgi:hypothetical protein